MSDWGLAGFPNLSNFCFYILLTLSTVPNEWHKYHPAGVWGGCEQIWQLQVCACARRACVCICYSAWVRIHVQAIGTTFSLSIQVLHWHCPELPPVTHSTLQLPWSVLWGLWWSSWRGRYWMQSRSWSHCAHGVSLSPPTDTFPYSSPTIFIGCLPNRGVAFCFIFYWLLMAIIIALFLTGGVTYTEVCRPLFEKSDSGVIKVSISLVYCRFQLFKISVTSCMHEINLKCKIIFMWSVFIPQLADAILESEYDYKYGIQQVLE